MLNNHFTEKLLGLKDVIIKNVDLIDGKHVLDIVMEQRIHKCPVCGEYTSKVHDYRTQIVKHTPSGGYPVELRIRKRRHVCPNCGKRFYESVSFLPKYQRTTNALWGYALSELSSSRSMKSVAKQLGVSIPTIERIIDSVSYCCNRLPETISIDEFRGNSGGEKFQCILTDPRGKKVLDILPNRKSEDLYKYFSGFDNRKDVKYVVIDLSKHFKRVATACFPKAEIVADKFHAVRLSIFALENIRVEEQKNFSKSRRKYFKRSRTLLIKHKDKLKPEELEQVSIMLSLSKPIAEAYYLKELAYELFESEDIFTAKKRLLSFKMAAQVADLKAFNKVVKTYTEWEKEILNIFTTKLSNGFTEGCNNRIKVIKRIGYGMPDFARFRKRILHQMSQ